MKKYKAAAVSYINTKPFLYGIFKNGLDAEIDLELAIPSECARMLKAGEADFALVPVAIIPELDQPEIISDYCIGADGPVKTVCIFSDVPLEEVETLYLDHHSRTSVELTKILLQEYWNLSPVLIHAEEGYEEYIHGTTAGLVIGDRAVMLKRKYPYCYDLGTIWKAHTGLPFVFAAWVSCRPLPESFVNRLNVALKLGIEQIPQLTLLIPAPSPDFDLKTYFMQNISYGLDAAKRKGLSLFLQKMNQAVSV